MGEGEPGKNEDPLRDAEGRLFVKKEWFQAFVRGVSLVPQHGDGIRLCLAQATLKDPTTNWEDYADSVLSPTQLASLAHARDAQFKHKEPANPTRINELWSFYRNTMMDMLEQYITFRDPSSVAGTMDKALLMKLYFTDKENEAKISTLNKMLTVITTVSLKRPDVLEFLQRYRDDFKTLEIKDGEPILWLIYRPRFMEILKEDIAPAFGGQVPESFESLFALRD